MKVAYSVAGSLRTGEFCSCAPLTSASDVFNSDEAIIVVFGKEYVENTLTVKKIVKHTYMQHTLICRLLVWHMTGEDFYCDVQGLVMVVDSFGHESLSLLLHENIAVALRWLQREKTAQMQPGKYEIRGQSLYAIVDEYTTRSRQACRLETHRRYIDVQYVVSGRELMGYAPAASLKPDGLYEHERDVQFHCGRADFLLLRQGMFAVMLPEDAHMPGVAVDGQPAAVKKIVVKVAVELL